MLTIFQAVKFALFCWYSFNNWDLETWTNLPPCRDFLNEVNACLLARDPGFQVHETILWHDNLQKIKVEPGQSNSAMDAADSKLNALSDDARKAAWEHDTLQLARDCAQVGKMFQANEKSVRAERLRNITHMRQENSIGASLVESYMESHARHRSGSEQDLLVAVGQAGFQKSYNQVSCSKGFCLDLFKSVWWTLKAWHYSNPKKTLVVMSFIQSKGCKLGTLLGHKVWHTYILR